jgi:hypothetical protein
MRFGLALVSALIVLVTAARAAQIIPTGVEYTNDTIQQGGQLQACIVTAAIISPPAPETVNFQFMNVMGRPGFKVTAGDIDWKRKSIVAKRISGANFFTAQFNHPAAFNKNVTTEGQLVAMLTDDALRQQFLHAFFEGRYSIEFQRTDASDIRTYYIDQPPSAEVRNAFAKCLQTMAAYQPRAPQPQVQTAGATDGCGSRGGPGTRDANGNCESWQEVKAAEHHEEAKPAEHPEGSGCGSRGGPGARTASGKCRSWREAAAHHHRKR